jgi:hypothetical protein
MPGPANGPPWRRWRAFRPSPDRYQPKTRPARSSLGATPGFMVSPHEPADAAGWNALDRLGSRTRDRDPLSRGDVGAMRAYFEAPTVDDFRNSRSLGAPEVDGVSKLVRSEHVVHGEAGCRSCRRTGRRVLLPAQSRSASPAVESAAITRGRCISRGRWRYPQRGRRTRRRPHGRTPKQRGRRAGRWPTDNEPPSSRTYATASRAARRRP